MHYSKLNPIAGLLALQGAFSVKMLAFCITLGVTLTSAFSTATIVYFKALFRMICGTPNHLNSFVIQQATRELTLSIVDPWPIASL